MGEPLVSAVIITYNQEKYIEQTIECALAQKVDFGYEIVIGEDCSTDRTREICFHYQEKYPDLIRVVTSESNVGLMENFFRTVTSAKGRYFAVCGGDDFWHDPNKLIKQIKTMEKYPDCGMVHSDENVLYEDTGELIESLNSRNKLYYNDSSGDVLSLLFTGKYKVVASSCLYKMSLFRDFYDIQELRDNNVIIEDMPLFIHVAAHSEIYYQPEPLVTRRVVEGSITRKGFENQIRLWESVYSCYLLLYKKYQNKLLEDGIDIHSIHGLLNRLMFRSAFEANRHMIARKYYHEITNLAGKEYLRGADTLRYFITYLPCGVFSAKLVVKIYKQIRFLLTGKSKRSV